jgi:hypothetical protein
MATSITKTDLSRRFFLDVTQSGHVFIRQRGRKPNGALPVYSTDTAEEAEQIRVRHCHLARDGSGLYRLNEFAGDIEDLFKVGALFRATHETNRKRTG